MLSLTDVHYAIGGRILFDRMSMSLESATSTALVGPSGSGKSTLLGILAGMVPLERGERIAYGPGQDDSGPIVMSWIFQSSPLLARRTVAANVVLGGLASGLPHEQATDKALGALKLLGIRHLSGQKAFKLSGGEKQRVAVARSLAMGADVILADEPTAALDAINRELVCDALMATVQTGTTVVIATHDGYVAGRCSARIDLAQNMHSYNPDSTV